MKKLDSTFILFNIIIILATLFLLPTTEGISCGSAIEDLLPSFQPGTISISEQEKELQWFCDLANKENLDGFSIRSTGEGIKTHEYERDELSPFFKTLTGVSVEHKIIGEGDLVQILMEQMKTGRRIFDIYVNDADLIGTHLRFQQVVELYSFMADEAKDWTNPDLDLEDFLNIEFGQVDLSGVEGIDGDDVLLYQLPDQQFVNLYWFRYDLFTDPTYMKKFKDQYGYDLGVPMNWQAYEDIAQFWTNTQVNGLKVYGHLDYGKPSPSLQWRFTDAWLSIGGAADKGLPNGKPVDEWGIRADSDLIVRGSQVSRGGGANSPAAVYALEKYLQWFEYAPPQAKTEWTWTTAGPQGSRGDITQRVFQYVTWLSDNSYLERGSPVLDVEGNPLWRVAPTPVGKFWEENMKVGYQDAGSWTIPRNTVNKKRLTSWLWAQFCVSKTVSLRKFLKGGTPFRNSVLQADFITQRIEKWGGLIDFLKSEQRRAWTDSGVNIPHYPALSTVWAEAIGDASTGTIQSQEAMDRIAFDIDALLQRMKLPAFSPELSEERSDSYWFGQPGAPVRSAPEQKGFTMPYETIQLCWAQLETGKDEGLNPECCQMRGVPGTVQGKKYC